MAGSALRRLMAEYKRKFCLHIINQQNFKMSFLSIKYRAPYNTKSIGELYLDNVSYI